MLKDDYDSQIVSQEVIDNAISLMRSLPPRVLEKLSVSDLTPTSYGTIVFDWYDADENVVSVEIGTTKIEGFYNFGSGSKLLDTELIRNLDSAKGLLRNKMTITGG